MKADHAASDEQWAAITAPLRPTVVVAGAGSGKTTLMAQRVVWLVATGKVRPEEVLGLTFTTKAAAELRQPGHRRPAAPPGSSTGRSSSRGRTSSSHRRDLPRLRRQPPHRPRPPHRSRARHPGRLRRLALPARRPRHRAVHGPHRAADRPPRDRHPEPPRPRRRDERAPRRRGRRTPHGRGGPPRLRAGDRGGAGGQGPQDLPRAARQGDQRHRPAGRAAPARRRLPHAQGRPRADGLRRPDRPRRTTGRRPARGGRARARAVQGGAARRVPGHLRRAGHDAGPAVLRPRRRPRARPPGHGGRRPQPGDLRLARRLGVQHPQLRRDLPRRRRRARPAPADGQPSLRPADPRGRQPARRAAARGLRRQGRPAARVRDRGGGTRRDPRPRTGARRARLAGRRRHSRPTAPGRPGPTSACSRRDNAQAEEVYDALTVRGHPGRDRRPLGPGPAARGGRGRRDADPAARRHRQRRRCSPCSPVRAGRSARATCGCSPCGPREIAGVRGRKEAATVADQLLQIADGIDASELPALSDAVEVARRGVVLARGARPVRAARRRAAPAARPRRRPAARRRAPDHRHDRRRRRARLGHLARGRRAPRQPRPVREGRGRVPVRRRRRDAAGAAGLPHRRGRPGQRPRRRHPDRGRLGQAADGPPRQGPRVVRRSSASGWGRPASRATVRAPSGRPRLPCSPRRCGATAPTSRSSPGTTRPRSTPTARRPGPTTPRRSCGWATSPTPAPPTTSPSRPTSGASARRPSGPRTTSAWCATSSRSGASRRALAREARAQGRPTPTTTSTRPGPGRCPARARRRRRRLAAAELVRTIDRDRCPTRASTWSRPPGSPSGTTTSSSCSGRPARSAPTSIDLPLPSSLSATSMARLRDDPETFARELARPMPRPPAPAARFGTAFHAWVEDRFGQQALIEPDELPGRADAGIDDEADLGEVVKRFEDGPFGDRAPHAVEAPFALVLAGQVVRGRIDAVYAEPPTAPLPRRRLEDQPPRDRRPAPARPLPPGLGRAHRHAPRAGAGGVPLRPLRPHRRPTTCPGRSRAARGPARERRLPTARLAERSAPARRSQRGSVSSSADSRTQASRQRARSRPSRRRSARAPGRWSPRR